MTRPQILAPLLLALFSLAGYSTQSLGEAGHRHAEHATHNQEHPMAALRLNHGQRWPLDAHTRTQFATMDERIRRANPEQMMPADIRQLGRQLKQDTDRLIAGCTMTGPAHEQLHHYLQRHIPAVTAMAEEGHPENAARVLELLSLYPRYFD